VPTQHALRWLIVVLFLFFWHMTCDPFSSRQINGHPGGCGLRLRTQAEAILTNCTFEQHQCYGFGAGVMSDESAVTTYSSVFDSNSAWNDVNPNGGFSQAGGGAIFGANSVVTVGQGTIMRNNRAYRGGAVYLFTGCTSAFDSNNSFIVNNRAREGGGGIMWTDTMPSFTNVTRVNVRALHSYDLCRSCVTRR
jgi:hypothetical protein